jgi:hypothetical protein
MNLLRGQLTRADAKQCANGNNLYNLIIGAEKASTFDAACLKDIGKEVCVQFNWDKTGRFKNVGKWVMVADPTPAAGASPAATPAPAPAVSAGRGWGESPEKNASVFTRYGIDMALAYVQVGAGEEQRKQYVEPEQFAGLCAWCADQSYETYKGLLAKQAAKA